MLVHNHQAASTENGIILNRKLLTTKKDSFTKVQTSVLFDAKSIA
jgi:hypothetical protein